MEAVRQMFQILAVVAVVALCVLPIIVLLLIYVYLKRKMLQKIEYRRYFTSPGVFEGEEVSLVEEITNRCPLPLFFVEVETLIPDGLRLEDMEEGDTGEYISPFYLKGHMTIRRTHKVKCLKRGCFELESAGILFAWEMVYLDSYARLFVYPKTLFVEEKNRLELFLQNQDQSNRPLVRDLFTFSGIRDYEKGDSFHSINFKATARYGQLKVNNTDYLAGKRQMIYVNFQSSSDGMGVEAYRTYMERALCYSAYLIDKAVSQGYEVGFAANSRMVNGDNYVRYPMSRGGWNYEEILKELASIRMGRGNSLASLLEYDIKEQLSHTELYVMTIYTDERMEEKLKILEQMDNCVNLIWLTEIEEVREVG